MAETLMRFSEALAETVDHASTAVLRVDARRRLPGSGIVLSDAGAILTAHHIVEKEEEITVGLPDGGEIIADLVGRDPTTDLAVLQSADLSLDPPTWSDLESVKVGHLVLALGRPGGSTRATMGVVSAYGGGWRTPGGGQVDRYLQTDVVMYPGFSGGPLLDATGKVIGLNTSALVRGVSITVPMSTATTVAGAILEHGRVRRGFLGISAQAVPLPNAVSESLDQDRGLLVASVEAGSAAEKGGLMLGDTILRFGDMPMSRVDDLLMALTGERIGVETPVLLLRGGETLERSVVVGEKKSA